MLSPEISDQLQEFYDHQSAPDFYMCAYGSSIYDPENVTCDIDLMFVSSEPYHHSAEFLTATTDFIRELHAEHGRELDEEVPYDNKLIYSPFEIDDATSLACFKTKTGEIKVNPVEKTASFLGGKAIKLRLALNALTTPHEYFGLDDDEYTPQQEAAELAVTSLGIALTARRLITMDNIIENLSVGPNEEYGEYYLGYMIEHAAVKDHLGDFVERKLHRLTKAEIIGKRGFAYRIPETFNACELAEKFTLTENLRSRSLGP